MLKQNKIMAKDPQSEDVDWPTNKSDTISKGLAPEVRVTNID